MTPHSTDTVPVVTVLADDLSGAAEAASAFLDRATTLSLHLHAAEPHDGKGVVVTDLDTRTMTSRAAADTVRAAVAAQPAGVVVKKIDSLLRGHIGAEIAVLAEGGPVIVAAGLPTLGRTVRAGIPYVGATALHETDAWAAETAPPPRTVADLFRGRRTVSIPAQDPDLAATLVRAAAAEQIAVCDVTTDADLDAIVHASRTVPGVRLVGTSALAAAVARTLPPNRMPAELRSPSKTVLTVVGSAAPVAVEQVAALTGSGARHVAVHTDALLGGTSDPEPVRRALDHGAVVLTLAGDVRPADARALSAALGTFVAAAQSVHQPDLVLTGGETARAVVDALGLTTLRPVHEIHHGAVASVASDGRTVVTRPGSFGDAASLVRITAYLTATPPTRPQPSEDQP